MKPTQDSKKKTAASLRKRLSDISVTVESQDQVEVERTNALEVESGRATNSHSSTKEVGGPKGLEPTRYGDWESKGRCHDF